MYSSKEENITLIITDIIEPVTAMAVDSRVPSLDAPSLPVVTTVESEPVPEPVVSSDVPLVVLSQREEDLVSEPIMDLEDNSHAESVVEWVAESFVKKDFENSLETIVVENSESRESGAEEKENKNLSEEIYPEYSEVYIESEPENLPTETQENPLKTMSTESSTLPVTKKVPKLIFVVPYRDRWEQYQFFDDHMRTRILSVYDKDDYLILYAHQTDNRSFNRGAMKNIGFLAGKSLFPNDYQNITFVFNDVDTMPYVKNFLNYETWPGNVKHFYGYHFALGGIVSMTGGDFERINGYPNLFSWSCEDNTLQKRVVENGLTIDRSQFYPIMDKHILQNKDGLHKVVNRTEHDRVYYGSTEGISNLLASGDLSYDYDESTGFVNVKTFSTGFDYNTDADKIHKITDGTKIWKDVGRGGKRGGMFAMRFG